MRESYEGFDDIFGDGEIYDGADICWYYMRESCYDYDDDTASDTGFKKFKFDSTVSFYNDSINSN
jgi:hypothetical protein